MFKNIQHRLTPEFSGVVTDAGIVINENTAEITVPTDKDKQDTEYPHAIDDDALLHEQAQSDGYDRPHVLTIPTLFTDWFCIDFSKTAPLFESFQWGDNTYFQLDALEVVEQLMSDPSFIGEGFYAYYHEERLYLGYVGEGVKQISNFGWSALSELPFKASTTHPTDYRRDMVYDTVSFKSVTIPSATHPITQKVATELSTTKYVIDFLDKQPKLSSFVWDGEEYIDVDAEKLNELMYGSSKWVDCSMFADLVDNVLTIITMNDRSAVSSFAWVCDDTVRFKDSEYGDWTYTKAMSYNVTTFHRQEEHVGKDVVGVRDFNGGDGVWHRLIAVDELGDDPLTFSSEDHWMLPPSTIIQYKRVGEDMVWSISGETPLDAMELEIAYINDTNIMSPTYLNGGETQRITIPKADQYNDLLLLNLVSTKSIIIQSVHQ